VFPVVTRGMKRTVSDTKVFDSVDLEITVYATGIASRPLVAVHVWWRMVIVESRMKSFQLAGRYFALTERAKRSRVADFPAQLHAGDCGFHVVSEMV